MSLNYSSNTDRSVCEVSFCFIYVLQKRTHSLDVLNRILFCPFWSSPSLICGISALVSKKNSMYNN